MTLAKRELQGAEAELKIADAVKDLEELAQKAKESAVQLSEGNTGDMSKVIDYLTVDVMPCEERVKTVLADEVFNQVLSSKKRPAEKDPQQIARYEAYVERTIEAHHQLWQHIERIVWMFFKAAVENSLQKCSEALVSDGEHEFLDPVSEAKGRCLLDIRSIERALSVDDIATHTVFDEVVKQQKKTHIGHAPRGARFGVFQLCGQDPQGHLQMRINQCMCQIETAGGRRAMGCRRFEAYGQFGQKGACNEVGHL